MVVRDEIDSDYEAVRGIHEAAFGQAGEARLVELLRTSAFPRVSLVAERAGELAGHVFVSPVTIEGRPPRSPCGGLGPVGVKPSCQGGGIGSALVREALARCSRVGWSAVFLLGEPAYYARFGFVLAAPRGLHYENDSFDSHFQLLELEPGALSGARGWVRYHEAFSQV
jgi:putative acetyltransferase